MNVVFLLYLALFEFILQSSHPILSWQKSKQPEFTVYSFTTELPLFTSRSRLPVRQTRPLRWGRRFEKISRPRWVSKGYRVIFSQLRLWVLCPVIETQVCIFIFASPIGQHLLQSILMVKIRGEFSLVVERCQHLSEVLF